MLMTALFLVLPSCSKNDVNVTLTPSEEVVNAFQQKYPDVKNVKWEILYGIFARSSRRAALVFSIFFAAIEQK